MHKRLFQICAASWWIVSSVFAADLEVRVRLEAPLRSDGTQPGSALCATVVEPLISEDRVLLPVGAIIHGEVQKTRPVGLGLIRDRAWIDVAFHEYELPDGRRFPFTSRVESVDNAKEEVTSTGRIRGVVAASHPYGLIQGVWFQPRPSLLFRSMTGLTGASGKVWTRYSLGAPGALALLAVRFALIRLPEPEISLARGTELRLDVLKLADDAPGFAQSPPDQEAAAIGATLGEATFTVQKAGGKAADDIINLAFIGARGQIEDAFLRAGWSPAEKLTAGSFARTYRAFTTMRAYPTAPVSLLLYNGEPPSMVFQKSLNTLAKRDHVRIWPAPGNDNVWLAAATHDVAIAFEKRAMTFSHRIEREVDRERATIAADLALAGCSAPAAYIDRPEAQRVAGDGIRTDGHLAVLRLLPCSPGARSTATREIAVPERSQKSLLARFTRRLSLETRYYLIRGNVYYWGFNKLFRKRANQDTL